MAAMWHGEAGAQRVLVATRTVDREWLGRRSGPGYRAGVEAFDRHFAACDNARLPGERLPLSIGTAQVGWVSPDFSHHLAGLPGFSVRPDSVVVDPAQPDALTQAAQTLCQRGVLHWRSEAFDVRADENGPVLARLDRGALPAFGVLALGAHLNGLVRRADGLHVWVGKRSAHKLLDPGKLDNIVAGGVPAGLSPLQTLIKEAGEEAGMPEAMARAAAAVGQIAYAMERPEGLRRDVLHCYDVDLAEDFVPHPEDDEIEFFELWPIERVYAAVRDTDDFKFNVNLVLIDLFRRLGMPT
jgi:8-oxo-dGTP pyrophosphatase MutT (NUDIX family)